MHETLKVFFSGIRRRHLPTLYRRSPLPAFFLAFLSLATAVSAAETEHKTGHSQLAHVFLRLYPNYTQVEASHCLCQTVKETPSISASPLCFKADSSSRIRLVLHKKDRLNAISLTICPETKKIGEIVIYSELLEQLVSPSEIAFVIAHEMAHLDAGHVLPPLGPTVLSHSQMEEIASIRRRWEHEADIRALDKIVDAGYSAKAPEDLLRRIDTANYPLKSAEYSNFYQHPDSPARLLAINRYS